MGIPSVRSSGYYGHLIKLRDPTGILRAHSVCDKDSPYLPMPIGKGTTEGTVGLGKSLLLKEPIPRLVFTLQVM
jgi:hypothetical protein